MVNIRHLNQTPHGSLAIGTSVGVVGASHFEIPDLASPNYLALWDADAEKIAARRQPCQHLELRRRVGDRPQACLVVRHLSLQLRDCLTQELVPLVVHLLVVLHHQLDVIKPRLDPVNKALQLLDDKVIVHTLFIAQLFLLNNEKVLQVSPIVSAHLFIYNTFSINSF